MEGEERGITGFATDDKEEEAMPTRAETSRGLLRVHFCQEGFFLHGFHNTRAPQLHSANEREALVRARSARDSGSCAGRNPRFVRVVVPTGFLAHADSHGVRDGFACEL